ncbi:MAG: hypothetical protein QOD66_1492 [Solirubrobacteraceae bacterium]|jgi:hypothetical protein|nr:hypothetical protein [Solirubrobacteraceae bacterium]
MNGSRLSPADEEGFVIVIALVILAVALAFGAAGLSEALSSRSLTARDGRERRAQQAADAGVQRILYEQSESSITNWNLNGGPLGLSSVLDCLPVQLNSSLQITGLVSAAVNAAGVCPQTAGSSPPSYTAPLGNHAFETSEFIPAQTNFLGGAEREYYPKIVALGWDDNGSDKVYSRQEVILAPIAPLQAIEGMNNVTVNGLGAVGLNTAVTFNGDIYSRATLSLPTVFVGVNLSTSSGSVLATVAAPTISGSLVATVNGGTVSQSQIIQRPAITISAAKSSCPSGGCPSVSGAVGTDGYRSSTDTFTMTSAAESATFAPGDYVFCNFNVTAGTVNVNPTASAPVRIFIDNPNSTRCKSNGLGSSQGNFTAATGIKNLLSGTVAPSGFQVYLAGDGGGYDNATSVNIGDSAVCTLTVLGTCTTMSTPVTQSMVIYAPTSAVTVNTGVCLLKVGGVCTLGAAGVFSGAMIGNTVNVTASAITQDLDLGNYPLYNGISVFRPVQYIQCSSTLTSLTGDASTDTSGC